MVSSGSSDFGVSLGPASSCCMIFTGRSGLGAPPFLAPLALVDDPAPSISGVPVRLVPECPLILLVSPLGRPAPENSVVCPSADVAVGSGTMKGSGW